MGALVAIIVFLCYGAYVMGAQAEKIATLEDIIFNSKGEIHGNPVTNKNH